MQAAEKIQFQTLVNQSLMGLGSGRGNSPTLPAAPMIRLVDRIIHDAIDQQSSDIHVEPLTGGLRVRFRVDGILRAPYPLLPSQLKETMVSRIKVMARLNTAEHRLPQDGRFTYDYDGIPVDVRVASMPVVNGEKVVLRLLSGARRLLHLSEMDFSPENERLFRRWCHAPYGLILNVGPVNSGKTTTLYAALNELNTPGKNIVSIEDPVEYYLEGINQMQINQQISLSFAVGLRAILRQDFDVCMVGEIRDEETADIAVKAALTGRLMLTTLHTANAVDAIFRLLDMGVKPYFLFAALLGIVAQRLVLRLCPECREAYVVEPGSADAAVLGPLFTEGVTAYRPVGCEKCGGTGYNGRMAIQELLPATEDLQQAVLAGANRRETSELARKLGMATLLEDGLKKALAGETSIEEVGRVVYGAI